MIGKTNIAVDGKVLSKIAFGTHKFNLSKLKECSVILDEYFENGGNIIDTARCYGNGESEKCIGEWLAASGARDHTVLITKGCNPNFTDGKYRSRITPDDLESDITQSLEALKSDYIDVYFLHKDDNNLEPAEAIEMLNKYVKMGIIRHIGASNWSTSRISKANEYAKKHNLKPFEYSQLAFSLKDRSTGSWGPKELALEMNKADFEWYRDNDLPVFGFNSQAYGFFYNDITGDVSDINRRIHTLLRDISFNRGISIQKALFGFYFGCGITNIPIATTQNIDRLRELINNCNTSLDESDVRDLLTIRFQN